MTDENQQSVESFVASEQYTQKDLERWKQGAERFKVYWDKTRIRRSPEHLPNQRGTLAAIFLGEKPAGFGVKLANDTKSELEQSGLKFAGPYVYDPELVKDVCQQYEKDFQIFGSSSPDQIMQQLSQVGAQEFDLQRGLVLGFPRSAIEDYVRVGTFEANKTLLSLFELLDFPEEKKIFRIEFFC